MSWHCVLKVLSLLLRIYLCVSEEVGNQFVIDAEVGSQFVIDTEVAQVPR